MHQSLSFALQHRACFVLKMEFLMCYADTIFFFSILGAAFDVSDSVFLVV